MRNKILSDILKKPFVKKERPKTSLAFQLGYYVGETLMRRHVPTLSIDSIHSGKVISVTCAESDMYRKLKDDWFNEKDEIIKQELWVKLRETWSILADKYLPQTLECHIGVIDIEDKDLLEFKKGVSFALWDSDCCDYNIDIDKIELSHDEDFSTIKLVRP